ncbi:MAG: hypothetical protein ABR606_16095 [Vicinamibacterales bacterium]
MLSPAFLAILMVTAGAARAQVDPNHKDANDKRPSVSLRASPAVAFAPARIRLSAELRGGSDDFEALYCPVIEWDWGDGTTSSSAADCAPYEAGKSEIRRRYSVEHIYRAPGGYRIQFRLKKGTRINGFAQATVQVRAGLP